MKARRGLIIWTAALALSLLSLCILSPAASSHGVPASGSSSGREALSAAFSATAADNKVELTVHVVNVAAEPVSGAHVNVYVGSFFNRTPGNLVPRPADYQSDTSPAGLAAFHIAVPDGATHLYISLEVSREDMGTQRLNADLLTDGRIKRGDPLEVKLLPKDATSSNTDIFNVTFTVEDKEQNPVEGASVMLKGDLLDPQRGVTGADGRVTIKVANNSYKYDLTADFRVAASKPGYKGNGSTLTLKYSQRGKDISGGTLVLEKLPSTGVDVAVTIHVRDEKTNEGVREAQVRLIGGDTYRGVTNENGDATVHVLEAGSLSVQIAQNFYEPGSGSVQVAKDETAKAIEISLTPKEKKRRKPDVIDVTVLAKDPTDGTARPLAGAVVRDSTGSTPTDGSGHAQLIGEYDVRQDVTVEAPDYKSQTKSVRLNKYVPDETGTGTVSFTLEPSLTENTQLRLQVRVVDPKGNGINHAGVDFFSAGRLLYGDYTNADGTTDFKSDAVRQTVPLSELRGGLTINVSADGYKPVVNNAITADYLKPSMTTITYNVTLDKDWSGLTDAIAALEPRVDAWAGDMSSSSAVNANEFIDKALAARKQAEQLLLEMKAAQDALGQGLGPTASLTDKASPLQQEIAASSIRANQDYEDIKKTLEDASNAVAKCSTPADAEALRSSYRRAIKLLADIGVLNKKAARDRDDLSALAQKSLADREVVSDARSKVAQIRSQAEAATDAANGATAYYAHLADVRNSLLSRQMALIGELATLSVRYDSETAGMPITDELRSLKYRIDTMQHRLYTNDRAVGAPILQQPAQAIPQSITDAVSAVNNINLQAETIVESLQAFAGDIDTMDQTADGVNTTLTNASFEIGLAADLPAQADACAKNVAATNSADAPTVESLPEDNPNSNKTSGILPGDSTGTVKLPPTVEEIPEDKPKPAAPAPNDGGDWLKKAVNGINNKSKNAVDQVAGNSANGANQPPKVEEIPEDRPGANAAANKSSGSGNNQPPKVEEIPEDKSKPRGPTKSDNPPDRTNGNKSVGDGAENSGPDRPGPKRGTPDGWRNLPMRDLCTLLPANLSWGNVQKNKPLRAGEPPAGVGSCYATSDDMPTPGDLRGSVVVEIHRYADPATAVKNTCGFEPDKQAEFGDASCGVRRESGYQFQAGFTVGPIGVHIGSHGTRFQQGQDTARAIVTAVKSWMNK
jgi:protocatechuate 3,4-dioxygenase beta subunit